MSKLIAVSKDNNWQDGTTTIWLAGNLLDDAVWGVVFEGSSDPVLVDCDGAPAEGQAAAVGVLENILDAAHRAMESL